MAPLYKCRNGRRFVYSQFLIAVRYVLKYPHSFLLVWVGRFGWFTEPAFFFEVLLMAEDKEIDKKRTMILRKVAQCASKHERSFTVPDDYLEAARLVAEDSKDVPKVCGDTPFRLSGHTFSW